MNDKKDEGFQGNGWDNIDMYDYYETYPRKKDLKVLKIIEKREGLSQQMFRKHMTLDRDGE